MPKTIPDSKLVELLQVVKRFPDGASLKDLIVVCREVPRRTLQRWLSILVENGRLVKIGAGRATRYRVPVVHDVSVEEKLQFTDRVDAEYYISLSPEGETVKLLVSQPIHSRSPVTYDREFLDTYRPNETFYLSEELRQNLLAQGKSRAGEYPAGTYAKHIFDRLLIDLSWNSSRLEGNTYSLLETERLLKLGESVDDKDTAEAQMILNHKAAIELLVEQANEIGFNRYTVLNLHALLSYNLLNDPDAVGQLRKRPVSIGGSVYVPLAVPQQIEECFQQILQVAAVITDPFEQAFFTMVHFPYLQPFEDVNKRVSRLAANIPLIRENLCPLSFVDVPQQAYVDGILGVYELNRIELFRDVFIWAYQRSCARYSVVRQSLGEPDKFRFKYRAHIADLISIVVRENVSRENAVSLIKSYAAEHIPGPSQNRFVEIVETELMHLHEGNIARFRIRPNEFKTWQENWR